MRFLYAHFDALFNPLLNSFDVRGDEISTICRRDFNRCHEGLPFLILAMLVKPLETLNAVDSPTIESFDGLAADLKILDRPTAMFPYSPSKINKNQTTNLVFIFMTQMISVETINLDKRVDENLANEMVQHFTGDSKTKKTLFKIGLQITIYALGKSRISAANSRTALRSGTKQLKREAEEIYGKAVDQIFWPEKYGVKLSQTQRETFIKVLRRLVKAYLQHEDHYKWFA